MLPCYWQDRVSVTEINCVPVYGTSTGSGLGCAHRAEIGEGGTKPAEFQISFFLPPTSVCTSAYCRAVLPSSMGFLLP